MNRRTILVMVLILALLAAAAVAMAAGAQKVESPVIAVIDGAAQTPASDGTETADEGGEMMGEEEFAEVFGLCGVIVNINGDTIVFDDAQHGMIQANLTDDTLFEGVELGALQVGQMIFVDYDGKMTRSLPAQVTALRVYAHMITGKVTQVGDGSATIEQDGTGMEIVLHLPEGHDPIAAGDHVTAVTNGAMTMSLPPQASAVQITVDAQTGAN